METENSVVTVEGIAMGEGGRGYGGINVNGKIQ